MPPVLTQGKTMNLNISQIQKSGVVKSDLVEKTITYQAEDGSKVSGKVFVMRASWADTVASFSVLHENKLDASVPSNQNAAKIHSLVRFGDGTEVLPFDSCMRLSFSLGSALTAALNEVNPAPVDDLGKA